jgi:ubiquinone/menaquinone biosynthesis C-methylase UbiE
MRISQMMISWIAITLAAVLLGGILYWLLVTTEGAFLGRRVVVWLYDITAHNYDDIKQFDEAAERLFMVRPLLHHLQPCPTPLILDVACGTGRVPLFLLNVPTFNGRVIGLDPSSHMLAQAVAKLKPFDGRAGLVQQTAVPLPFPTGTFDAVTCLESLEFFPADVDALREMVRVLQPGGILMVTRRRGWGAKAFLGRYRTRAEFEAMLVSLGLSQVDSQPWQVDYDQVFARKPAQ